MFGKGQLDILHKIRFIEALRSLNADFVLLDLGPGIDEETLDFFVTADNQILVTMPETTALENLAVFLRNVFNHKIDTVLQSLGLTGQEMDLRQGRLRRCNRRTNCCCAKTCRPRISFGGRFPV